MNSIKIFGFVTLISISIISCGPNIKDIAPKMKNDIDSISKLISSKIAFSQLAINATKSETTGERTSRDLDVVLTDASIKSYKRKDLDSLSDQIGSIVKQNVINIDIYDWVNITYETSDGSKPSDSTDHTTYVFRPSELK